MAKTGKASDKRNQRAAQCESQALTSAAVLQFSYKSMINWNEMRLPVVISLHKQIAEVSVEVEQSNVLRPGSSSSSSTPVEPQVSTQSTHLPSLPQPSRSPPRQPRNR